MNTITVKLTQMLHLINKRTQTIMNLTLLILLGCHVAELLNGRIETALALAHATDGQVDWFLSGGIKNPAEDSTSEADKMASQICPDNKCPGNWTLVHDTVATNTAENFIMADKQLDLHMYSDIYVITSGFHHGRAKAIADKVVTGNTFKWALSAVKLKDSEYWEKIHIRNVDEDVRKAIARFQS